MKKHPSSRGPKNRRRRSPAGHPQAELRDIARSIARRGLNVAGPKELVSLRIDADVLNWFKATGAGYQTRINAILRAYKDAAAGGGR